MGTSFDEDSDLYEQKILSTSPLKRARISQQRAKGPVKVPGFGELEN